MSDKHKKERQQGAKKKYIMDLIDPLTLGSISASRKYHEPRTSEEVDRMSPEERKRYFEEMDSMDSGMPDDMIKRNFDKRYKEQSPELMTPEQEAEKKRSVLQSLKKPARQAQAMPMPGDPSESGSVPQIPVDARGIMDPAGIPFGQMPGESDDDFTIAQPVPMASNKPLEDGSLDPSSGRIITRPQASLMATRRPARASRQA